MVNIVSTDFNQQGINALNAGVGIGNAFSRNQQLQIDRQRQVESDEQQRQLFGQKTQLNEQAISQNERVSGMGEMITALNLPYEKRNELFAELEATKQNPDAKKVLAHLQTLDDKEQLTTMLEMMTAQQNMGAGGESKYQKSTEGMVFNKKTGRYSRDPVFFENKKDINKLELSHKKELKKLEVEAAKAKSRIQGIAEREKKDIDDGLSAAQTMPILRRADKLLDMIGTGKPRQALMWAKKWLGIQAANETELDQLMGKQILKQLKPTFGSQFTENEGRWLADMEANFGKSTEGNRALIRQGMLLIEERTRIGMEAARFAGDERIEKNMQDWLDWSFSDDPQAEKKTTELSDTDLLKKYKVGG